MPQREITMKKTVKLLVASILAIVANSAIAESGKWYIGVGAGQSNYNDWVSQADITALKDEVGADLGVVNFNGSQSADSNDSAVGFKLFAGYTFYENIAVEFSYIDMGEVDANSRASGTFYDSVDRPLDGDLFATAKANVDALTLDVNLNVPITSFAALIVKAGVYAADTKLEFSAGGSIAAENVNDSKTTGSTGLHYGIGVNFKVTDAIGLRAEWERLDSVEARLDSVEANDGESDVDLLSAALIYNF
jgi:opacity protein-like surface antigen